MMHPDPVRLRALLGDGARACRRAITGEHGIALPPLIDHHVHAHLVDISSLPAHGIAGVVDLGGDPAALARRSRDDIPAVAYAGAFLTVRGGYPSTRPWAPAATVRALDADAAPSAVETAVDEQAMFGATVVKVALHADAGPVPDARLLGAIVAAARRRGMPVVAHAEGAGMARLALDAGVDVLAHAVFGEILDAALLARAARAQTWISTLGVHHGADAQRAPTNAAAFAAAGGRLLYGTDLGNGDQPLGVSVHELRLLDAAGVRGAALISSLTDPWPSTRPPHGVATFVPGPPPAATDELPEWLGAATVVPAEELVHDEP